MAAAVAEDGKTEVLDGGEGCHRVSVLVARGGLEDVAHDQLGLGYYGGQNLLVENIGVAGVVEGVLGSCCRPLRVDCSCW